GAGNDTLSVRRERTILYALAASLEAADLLPSDHIPQVDLPIPIDPMTPRQNETAIRRKQVASIVPRRESPDLPRLLWRGRDPRLIFALRIAHDRGDLHIAALQRHPPHAEPQALAALRLQLVLARAQAQGDALVRLRVDDAHDLAAPL